MAVTTFVAGKDGKTNHTVKKVDAKHVVSQCMTATKTDADKKLMKDKDGKVLKKMDDEDVPAEIRCGALIDTPKEKDGSPTNIRKKGVIGSDLTNSMVDDVHIHPKDTD